MQISGVTTSLLIPMDRIKSPGSGNVSSDTAALNFSADNFSSLVQEAAQQPEVRYDVVNDFKARIQSGNYPPQETVDGLVDVIGGSILQQAKSGASS
jgi:hypothetical protein